MNITTLVKHPIVTLLAIILGLASAACIRPVQTQTPVATTQMPTPVATPPQVVEPVVILVVDSFSSTGLEVNSSSFAESDYLSEDTFCLTTPDGQGLYVYQGIWETGEGVTATHGALVYSELEEILLQGDKSVNNAAEPIADQLAETQDAALPGMDWVTNIELWQTTYGPLMLVAVDTQYWDPGVAANHILNTIQAIDQGNWKLAEYDIQGAKGYVINMSFALVPCRLLGGDGVALQEYLRDYLNLVKDPDEPWYFTSDSGGFVGVNCDLIRQDMGTRDLCQLFETPEDMTSKPVISVAASGNVPGNHESYDPFPYPYMPGLFKNVVSVSASDGNPGAGYSNPGEIQMLGIHPTTNVSGTSFAAPRFSLQAALYLLRTEDLMCDGDFGSSSPPLNLNFFDNLDLSEATQRYCKDFNSP
ncbi:S8/S53 family peptidase [Candidatus Saccharibacteria bacterium]|nr:S8/S53 family peptidase [Candidatus Saccharibacteria bacterium]